MSKRQIVSVSYSCLLDEYGNMTDNGIELLTKIFSNYRLVIYTKDIDEVTKMLESKGINFNGVSDVKPPAFVTIDKNIICFDGNCDGLKEKIDSYYQGNNDIVFFDFDGVIHEYISPWINAATISDGIVRGIRELIDELRQTYKVVICSSRCGKEGGMDAIATYLDENDIIVDSVVESKPNSFVAIDDRAIPFTGDVDEVIEQLNSFVPWNKKLIKV